MRKKLLLISYCLLVIGLILPSLLPLFHSGFFRMHDYTHVARLYEMDKALKDGHFPVRWAKDLGWGYGMPLFNFYAPLPYFIAEGFHLLGFSFLLSIKIVFFLIFILAFWGMYFLVSYYFGSLGGIIGGVAFVYSPYRALDFYVRGSLGELFAISLIPWVVFLSAKLVSTHKKKYLVLGSLSLGALFISHTVLAMMSAVLLFLTALLLILLYKKRLESFFLVMGQFILGLGLVAFFLLPAYFEKEYTKVGILTQGYSDYAHHFLYLRQFIFGKWGYGESVTGIEDTMSFKLGIVQILLGFSTFILAGIKTIKKGVGRKEILFFCLSFLTGLLAFLSTYHAEFIWDGLDLMAFIQFPWRFNSFIIVFLSFLTGGFFFYLKNFLFLFEKRLVKRIGWGVVLFLSFILMIVNASYFKPDGYIDPKTLYFTDTESISKVMSRIIPDFIPKWVEKEPKNIVLKEYKVLTGGADVEVLESKTQRLKIKVKSKGSLSLQLNRFYFPGWNLYINGKRTDFNYKNNNGVVNFFLDKAGEFLIDFRLQSTKVQKVGNFISLLSLGLLLVIFIKKEEYLFKGKVSLK